MVRRASVAEVWNRKPLDDDDDDDDGGGGQQREEVTYVDFVGNEVTERMKAIPPRNRDRGECGHNTRRLDAFMGTEARATRTRGDGPPPPDVDDDAVAGAAAAGAASSFARRQVYARAQSIVSRNGKYSRPVPTRPDDDDNDRGRDEMYDGYNLKRSFRAEPYAPPTNRGDGVQGVVGGERRPVHHQVQLHRGDVSHQRRVEYEHAQLGHRKSAVDVRTTREVVMPSKWEQVGSSTSGSRAQQVL
jgi:hypothetical protein